MSEATWISDLRKQLEERAVTAAAAQEIRNSERIRKAGAALPGLLAWAGVSALQPFLQPGQMAMNERTVNFPVECPNLPPLCISMVENRKDGREEQSHCVHGWRVWMTVEDGVNNRPVMWHDTEIAALLWDVWIEEEDDDQDS